MKIKIFALILLVVFCGTVYGQTPTEKIKKEINRLTQAIQTAKSPAKKDQLRKLRQQQYSYLKKLTAPVSLVSPEAVVEEAPVSAEVAKPPKRINFEVGGTFGLFAGTTGFLGELRLPLRVIVGPAKLAFRLSSGLSQSPNMDRRFIPVCLDGILNFPPGWFSGVDNYLGAGVNYVALTTGRVAGTYGGQVFYGVQSDGFGGQVFGEIGYGILRTGFSPAQRGTTVLAGYRTEFGF